jgi:hypothetical protein
MNWQRSCTYELTLSKNREGVVKFGWYNGKVRVRVRVKVNGVCEVVGKSDWCCCWMLDVMGTRRLDAREI